MIQSITQHISVINVKNSATCFGSQKHHQAKYQNIVLVHSASAHTMVLHIVYRLCRRIFNIDYRYVVFLTE
jgi:hypothetical protein